jgi:hypothetical protein
MPSFTPIITCREWAAEFISLGGKAKKNLLLNSKEVIVVTATALPLL